MDKKLGGHWEPGCSLLWTDVQVEEDEKGCSHGVTCWWTHFSLLEHQASRAGGPVSISLRMRERERAHKAEQHVGLLW